MVDPGASVVVLCGPGNNGGDGFVAARLLAGAGVPKCSLSLLGNRAALKGDAATWRAQWTGKIGAKCRRISRGRATLSSTRLFGAGLSAVRWTALRPRSSRHVDASGKPVLAVDVPSGL